MSFKVALVSIDNEPLPDWVAPKLQEQGIDFVYRQCEQPAEVVAWAHDAEVVWVWGGATVVNAEILPKLTRTRVILRSGTGTDNIPVEEATQLGIVVANTPETTMHDVAEHAIALLMALLRHINVQGPAVRAGQWQDFHGWPNWRMHGRTLGLVGYGRIARLVRNKTRGFEMTTLAHDPVVDVAVMTKDGVEPVTMDELLERSDFVSLHCPLSTATYHLIGEPQLRKMKLEAVLINSARGKLIDEAALTRALRDRWITAAGLDVLEKQPPDPNHPLLQLDNVLITPHMAGRSDEHPHNFWTHSVRTITEMGKDRMPLWVVNSTVKPRWKVIHE